MGVDRRIGKLFGRPARDGGAALFAQSAIPYIDFGPGVISARAQDAHDVSISMKVSPYSVKFTPWCTCPEAVGLAGFCRHAWALFLAIDQIEPGTLSRIPPYVQVSRGLSPLLDPADRRPVYAKALGLLPNLSAPEPDDVGASAGLGPIAYVLCHADRAAQHHATERRLKFEVRGAREGAPGQWTPLKGLRISASSIAAMDDPADRDLCAVLVGAGATDPYGSRPYSDQGHSQWWLRPDAAANILPRMAATGRMFVRGADERFLPARWSEDLWSASVQIVPLARGTYRLDLGVSRGGQPHAGDDFEVLHEGSPGVLLRGGELARFESHGAWSLRPRLRGLPPMRLAAADAPGLARELAARGVRAPIDWPSGWGVRERRDVAPRPRLRLKAAQGDPTATCHLSFAYADAQVPWGAAGAVAFSDSGAGEEIIRRDLPAERALAAQLPPLGVRYDRSAGARTVKVSAIPKLVEALVAAGWEVSGEQGIYRSAGAFSLAFSSGIDWFELDGKLDYGGGLSADVGAVLDALASGAKFVKLGDGSVGMLPQDWLEREGKWLSLGKVRDGKVQFSRSQLAVIDALLLTLPAATCDRQISRAREKLGAFDRVQPIAAAEGFVGELRPYQQQGVGWLEFLHDFGFGGCLADDMGLGKTVQLLAHICHRRSKGDRGPWLVVAPKSVVANWVAEAAKFAPGLKVLNRTGSDRKGADGSTAAIGDADLVVTSYGLLRLDIEDLRQTTFSCVVLDEAQTIKNGTSQVAKAARLLRANRRLALTGTPVENRMEDLWSIFEFLNPGMLGTSKAFAAALRSADPKPDADAGGGAAADPAADPKLALEPRLAAEPRLALEPLRRALRPFILRRTKQAVATDLPARTDQTIRCELVGKQKVLYEGLRNHYRDTILGKIDKEGIAKSQIHILAALTRLRQAACHAGLLPDAPADAASAKFDTLLEMVTEIVSENHKVIVFSQFTSLLDLAQRRLVELGIAPERLDGQTPAKQRAAAVERFQSDPASKVFLISLKAGGVGLNLTAAEYVFLLDPWWNPAVEAQAIDRAHRIGQKNKVFAYRLIAANTVEERILELQSKKRDLADAIISGQEGPMKQLTREDLAWLLT